MTSQSAQDVTRLLARNPTLLSGPALGWDDLIEGYTLRGLLLRLG